MPNSRSTTSRYSRPSLEALDFEVNVLIKSSLASNTWKTYNTAVESLRKFRLLYDLPDIWPVPLHDIIQYIAYLSYEANSASTVNTYISGISHVHKLYSMEDNTKSFFVGKLIEGMKRKTPRKKDLRMPISLDLLTKLIGALSYICQSSYETKLFASAFSLAFFGLLRVGEFTSENKGIPGFHVIKFHDISIQNNERGEELHLKICSSKTDQAGNSTTLIICQQTNSIICPVRLMKSYLNVRQLAVESQLYVHFDDTRLTRYQFSAVLKKCLSFCEVPGHFKPHSFRIGGATEAKRLGINDDTIKQWGRWSSSVYLNYIRLKM